jgi:HAD superfamily hydrolase (TIGR01456 family)
MMLTDVIRWEVNVQLMSDILISKNGIPGSIRGANEKQHVEFHLASEDLLYQDSFKIPRIASGSFFFSLNHLFNMKYKRSIDYILYGKPSRKIFEFAKKQIEENNKNIDITNFYMIGDNPPVDIKGANDSGFVSILVRTGVFNGDPNDMINPAKYVVDDVGKAIDLILSLE